MTKLNDMQLVLLTSAGRREDGSLLPAPESLGDQPARIRKAIEALIKKELVAEQEGMTSAQLWRTDGDLTIGVVVTDAGRAIIDPPASVGTGGGPEATPAADTVAASTRPATKQALLIDLLKRTEGATLADIVDATGWLPHTSRAALTGLRKKGHAIAKEKVDGATRYQIKAAA
ncbi:DUF3489 domain-containing protein [Rhizorhabdus argentea]|uniref:DUF3489 domain-containing protein n=1 Tax=Rhizorhabdus argentea TaxID=1387174 RepID=UPI0030EEC3DB